MAYPWVLQPLFQGGAGIGMRLGGFALTTCLFQTHRKYQKAIRKFMDEVVVPDAAVNGPRGKGPSPEVNQKMAYVHTLFFHNQSH